MGVVFSWYAEVGRVVGVVLIWQMKVEFVIVEVGRVVGVTLVWWVEVEFLAVGEVEKVVGEVRVAVDVV